MRTEARRGASREVVRSNVERRGKSVERYRFEGIL